MGVNESICAGNIDLDTIHVICGGTSHRSGMACQGQGQGQDLHEDPRPLPRGHLEEEERGRECGNK